MCTYNYFVRQGLIQPDDDEEIGKIKQQGENNAYSRKSIRLDNKDDNQEEKEAL